MKSGVKFMIATVPEYRSAQSRSHVHRPAVPSGVFLESVTTCKSFFARTRLRSIIPSKMLDAEQKEMLKNEIKKVRLDANDQESLENIPIERLVENYIELSVEVIREMENRRDPVFLEVLRYAQMHLTREEFLSIQIEIYAACNKIAMKQCTLDRIAHLVVLHEPVP